MFYPRTSAKRFVSRPAPASPESSASQVLVRQEVESGEETAINSETFGLISRLLYLSRKCDMFSCFLQFMALVNNPSYCRGSWIAKDSRRKRSGVAACLRSPTIYCEFQRSLQSDEDFVQNAENYPLQNAKVSPHLTSLQTRKTPSSLSYSDRQPGVLLI